MRRTAPSVPLTCLALLSATLLAIGCGSNTNPTPITQTPTQTTNTPGNAPSCSACTPDRLFGPNDAGLKPGASVTFSALAYNSDNTLNNQGVTWAVEEGAAGGTITDAGVYTAPSTEGVYHVTATAKANSSLRNTVTVAVTATEFTVAGSMSTSRYYPTASLLPDGQVFIAGGMNDDYDYADPAELYDPSTSTFHPDGTVSRMLHTATVLTNGDVLLAGGWGEREITADLRKAGSGAIQPTGSMNTPRSDGHTATLLQDGRVLIAGGSNPEANGRPKPTQTAELYDPASGKFTPAGDMTTPRSGHSAAMLPNGRVLIVGGGATGAELYDPVTNSFLAAPGVSASRCSATAMPLADGRVLIAGGTDCSNKYTPLDTSEIYDPATGQSTPTGKLVAPQSGHTATLMPDGRVLLVGGSVPNLGQFFDPATGSFTFGPHLIYPRVGHTATVLLDGRVFIVGDGPYAEIYK